MTPLPDTVLYVIELPDHSTKGPGYATFVDKGRFMDFFEGAGTLVDQAQRQLRAANGTPVRWHVAESEAATAMRNLLRERGLGAQVEIIHTPPM